MFNYFFNYCPVVEYISISGNIYKYLKYYWKIIKRFWFYNYTWAEYHISWYSYNHYPVNPSIQEVWSKRLNKYCLLVMFYGFLYTYIIFNMSTYFSNKLKITNRHALVLSLFIFGVFMYKISKYFYNVLFLRDLKNAYFFYVLLYSYCIAYPYRVRVSYWKVTRMLNDIRFETYTLHRRDPTFSPYVGFLHEYCNKYTSIWFWWFMAIISGYIFYHLCYVVYYLLFYIIVHYTHVLIVQHTYEFYLVFPVVYYGLWYFLTHDNDHWHFELFDESSGMSMWTSEHDIDEYDHNIYKNNYYTSNISFTPIFYPYYDIPFFVVHTEQEYGETFHVEWTSEKLIFPEVFDNHSNSDDIYRKILHLFFGILTIF